MTLKAQLQRWRTADIVDAATAQRIQTYEDSKPGFGFSAAMFALGALAIVLGVAAVVASNWDAIPAIPKLVAHAILFTAKPWEEARASVRVKLVEHDDETYVLARSHRIAGRDPFGSLWGAGTRSNRCAGAACAS